MGNDAFKVDGLDHVELFVPDRQKAAQWYDRILGLSILPEYQHWSEDPRGPLMISPDGGTTKLALFQDPKLSASHGGYDQVAFRVDGPGFMAFIARLKDLDLRDRHGERLSAASVRDHRGAYSLHFLDPWNHRLEVTTYDCEYVRGRP